MTTLVPSTGYASLTDFLNDTGNPIYVDEDATDAAIRIMQTQDGLIRAMERRLNETLESLEALTTNLGIMVRCRPQ